MTGTSNSEHKAVALEQNNTALDFETMLRRHLSQGGSVVEACLGFDADTANAYLENALGASARSRYDSHLAGCPSCRRNFIEFSRFMQLPLPDSQIAPVAAKPSIWSHWKSVVAEWGEWLGVSSWQQGWATAGVAAAILIGVVSIQLWRQQQSIEPAGDSTAVNSSDGQKIQESLQNPPPTGLVEQSLGQGSSSLAAVAKVPTPDVSPIPVLPTAVSGPVVATASSAGQNFPLTTLPSPPQTQPVAGTLASSFAESQTFTAPARTALAESSAPVPPSAVEAERRENIVAAQIGPLPGDNPMAKKPKEPKDQKVTRGVFDKAFSFLPTRKSDDERKLEEKEIDPDAPKLLAVRRRDKVFNYQSGFWVDNAYRPEMAWRVTKVILGSDAYNQLLATEPLLKEYFAAGQAIVVWKDKIYKVVAK